MSTWPNRGASGGPCGGLEDRESRNVAAEVNPPLFAGEVAVLQAGVNLG